MSSVYPLYDTAYLKKKNNIEHQAPQTTDLPLHVLRYVDLSGSFLHPAFLALFSSPRCVSSRQSIPLPVKSKLLKVSGKLPRSMWTHLHGSGRWLLWTEKCMAGMRRFFCILAHAKISYLRSLSYYQKVLLHLKLSTRFSESNYPITKLDRFMEMWLVSTLCDGKSLLTAEYRPLSFGSRKSPKQFHVVNHVHQSKRCGSLPSSRKWHPATRNGGPLIRCHKMLWGNGDEASLSPSSQRNYIHSNNTAVATDTIYHKLSHPRSKFHTFEVSIYSGFQMAQDQTFSCKKSTA